MKTNTTEEINTRESANRAEFRKKVIDNLIELENKIKQRYEI